LTLFAPLRRAKALFKAAFESFPLRAPLMSFYMRMAFATSSRSAENYTRRSSMLADSAG
jgi:hypothetical protein